MRERIGRTDAVKVATATRLDNMAIMFARRARGEECRIEVIGELSGQNSGLMKGMSQRNIRKQECDQKSCPGKGVPLHATCRDAKRRLGR